jgi:crotonobetainyl-CoA:carnitine CoA-transferase CaiB-like acyl-CoA transferase
MTPPLEGIRVLAIEQYGAGPWGTLHLADLGAEVIKIEDPSSQGDIGRYVPPFQEEEDSLFFETFNRNKRSISLNLRVGEARRAFEDLVEHSDVVYSNLRGDQPAKLRLRYADLAHLNPGIVCCALSAFGQTGPRASEPGYDYIMQGLAGWMSLTGAPDSEPVRAGPPAVDLAAGYASALAVLAGVIRARRDGLGCDCDISLFETALQQLVYTATWVATRGYVPTRRASSAHPSIVPFQSFRTADGWIIVACPKQHFWEALCRALGRADLASDARFADFESRDLHRDSLVPELEAEFAPRTTNECIEILTKERVPHGRVNTVGEALREPQVAAREMLVGTPHPRFGEVKQIASALHVGGERKPLRRAPFRGEHTTEVLMTICGYAASDVARLKAAGALD